MKLYKKMLYLLLFFFLVAWSIDSNAASSGTCQNLKRENIQLGKKYQDLYAGLGMVRKDVTQAHRDIKDGKVTYDKIEKDLKYLKHTFPNEPEKWRSTASALERQQLFIDKRKGLIRDVEAHIKEKYTTPMAEMKTRMSKLQNAMREINCK